MIGDNSKHYLMHIYELDEQGKVKKLISGKKIGDMEMTGKELKITLLDKKRNIVMISSSLKPLNMVWIYDLSESENIKSAVECFDFEKKEQIFSNLKSLCTWYKTSLKQ